LNPKGVSPCKTAPAHDWFKLYTLIFNCVF